MKKKILLLIIMLFSCTTILAEDKKFGLGVIIGDPTGISLKLWHEKNIAYDGAIAWTTEGKEDVLHLHADFLMHMYNFIDIEKGKLPFYFGIGGRIMFEKDDKVGVRIPVGLSYEFEKAPLDIFFEIVPILDLIPNTELNFNAGIGIRYFF